MQLWMFRQSAVATHGPIERHQTVVQNIAICIDLPASAEPRRLPRHARFEAVQSITGLVLTPRWKSGIGMDSDPVGSTSDDTRKSMGRQIHAHVAGAWTLSSTKGRPIWLLTLLWIPLGCCTLRIVQQHPGLVCGVAHSMGVPI